MLIHPTGLFRETIFRPLGGAGPSYFIRPTSPINCISSRTWGAGRPQVGLCPIFLVDSAAVGFNFQGITAGNAEVGTLVCLVSQQDSLTVCSSLVCLHLVCLLTLSYSTSVVVLFKVQPTLN